MSTENKSNNFQIVGIEIRRGAFFGSLDIFETGIKITGAFKSFGFNLKEIKVDYKEKLYFFAILESDKFIELTEKDFINLKSIVSSITKNENSVYSFNLTGYGNEILNGKITLS